MDPLSQGVLGASAPGTIAPKHQQRVALALGFFGGMAPDLDVFIRSSTDPLLFLEFHRHFTHALIFIPIGGLICALVLHQLLGRRKGLEFKQTYLYCTLGYATHALLDSCTTYGTQLLWPFSDVRIAWNTISVVDPVFTIPILLLVMLAAWRQRTLFTRLALVWAVAYPSLGIIQRERAEEAGWALAESRGHQPLRLEAKPSFGNMLLWKIVYETDGYFHVDAIRVGRDTRTYPGEAVPRLDLERDFPWLDASSQQALDVERFRWFSNDYLAIDPGHPYRITDIRYSMIPNQVRGLWSIELSRDATPDQHVGYLETRDTDSGVLQRFGTMLFE